MSEKIKDVMAKIESHLFFESKHSHNRQCDDMTLKHLMIALEWQKRKIDKHPVKEVGTYES